MSPLGGSAVLRVTDADGVTHTHVLNWPLKLRAAPGYRKTRYVNDALDFSAREVITVGSGREELEAVLRFDRLPHSLLAVLTAAADGNVLTYYPVSGGLGYDLWLLNVDQVAQLAQDADRYGFGEYQFPVRFRDASAAGAYLESLYSPWLWRMRGGQRRKFSSFTRSGATATYVDVDRLLKTAAADVLRTTWREDADGDWVPYTLLEGPAYTNLVSTDDVAGGWTIINSGGAGVVTSGISDPRGGTNAFRLTDDTASQEYVRLAVTYTGDGSKVATFAVRQSGSAPAGGHAVEIFDATAVVSRGRIIWTGWTDGQPTGVLAAGGATYLGMWYAGNGYWAIDFLAASVVAANTNQVRVYPAHTAADTAALDFYVANTFDATVPLRSLLTASGVKGAEAFSDSFPWAPQQLAAMGGATVYLDFIEGEVPNWVAEGGTATRLLQIGATGATAPFLRVQRATGSGSYQVGHSNGVVAEVVSTAALSGTRGARIQLAAQFAPSGAVTLLGRKDGTTDANGSPSSAASPSSAWSGALVSLGGVGASGRGIQDYADAVVFPGLLSIDECEALLG